MKRTLVGVNSPEKVELNWRENCFIQLVSRQDIIKVGNVSLILFPISFLMFAFSGYLLVSMKDPIYSSNILASLCSLALTALGCVILSCPSYLDKLIFLNNLYKRKKLLFNPHLKDIFLEIEDPNTYDLVKVKAEDCGLLRVEHTYISIELTGHQAKLDRKYLNINLKKGTQGLVGVELSYPNYISNPEWRVVCNAPFQSLNLFHLMQPTRAKWLYNKLTSSDS